MSHSTLFSLIVSIIFVASSAERCPPVFGEFECALGHTCKDGQCVDRNQQTTTVCSFEIECVEGTSCIEGRCYPLSAVKCNRHVLVAEGQARSIVTDCGKRGKCLNGQCVLDRCMGVSCDDGEVCRDGKCAKLVDGFCLGHADCGPNMNCLQNKCQLKENEPICNCQPHEMCQHGQCYPNAQCTSIFCPISSYCVEGQCINAVGKDCREESCRGGTICIEGVCASDPCPQRCPYDQDCRLGQCRLMEGIPCVGECKHPFSCIDGRCRRNDCSRKVCQLGEACEGGNCVRVDGRFCTFGARDCGAMFACRENKCVDLLTPLNNSLVQ